MKVLIYIEMRNVNVLRTRNVESGISALHHCMKRMKFLGSRTFEMSGEKITQFNYEKELENGKVQEVRVAFVE